MTIPFSKSNFTNTIYKNVTSVLKSGWLTHGKFTKLFEDEFRRYTKSNYAVTVSSCTAGLHLSCLAAGFKKGDEVIVTAMSHTATSHAVEYTGAKVKFVDIENLTGNIDISEIEKNISKKTKGLILVHMAGYPCDMKKILKICKRYKITLLEDCAHAVGTFYDKRHVGNFGMSGSFSFYPTKQITTGEGGIVITKSKKIYEKIRSLKGFGIDKDINQRKKQGQYDVKYLGFNYRMTDFQAALGYEQIKKYNLNLKKRKQIAKRYNKNFKNNDEVQSMPLNDDCSYFVFQIFVKNRDKILKLLKKKKYQVSVHYATPLPWMTYYYSKYKLKNKFFLKTINYAKTNISLPCYPKMKMKDVDKISRVIINGSKKNVKK